MWLLVLPLGRASPVYITRVRKAGSLTEAARKTGSPPLNKHLFYFHSLPLYNLLPTLDTQKEALTEAAGETGLPLNRHLFVTFIAVGLVCLFRNSEGLFGFLPFVPQSIYHSE